MKDHDECDTADSKSALSSINNLSLSDMAKHLKKWSESLGSAWIWVIKLAGCDMKPANMFVVCNKPLSIYKWQDILWVALETTSILWLMSGHGIS